MGVAAAVAGVLMYETSKRLDEEAKKQNSAVPDGTAGSESNNQNKEK